MNNVADKRLVLKLLLIPFCLIVFLSAGSRAAYGATRYESEPNNTYGTADITYDDDNNYGYISSTRDVDWWKVKFSSAGSANFWLGNIPSGCDYDLYLYSSNGTTLLKSSAKNGNADELITYNVSANVYYYVKITSYSGSSTSSRYWFRAKLYPDPAPSTTITKSDRQSATLLFQTTQKGTLVLITSVVNYNLTVEHQQSGTSTRKIIKAYHYAQASQPNNPELGSVEVTAAYSGIKYTRNGSTTTHWPSFGGSVYVAPGYLWDYKVDSAGYSFPYSGTVNVTSTAHFYATKALIPRTKDNSLSVP